MNCRTMIIPEKIRPEDRGVYLAYYILGIQSRDRLREMFPYKGRNTLWIKIKRIRKAVGTV